MRLVGWRQQAYRNYSCGSKWIRRYDAIIGSAGDICCVRSQIGTLALKKLLQVAISFTMALKLVHEDWFIRTVMGTM